MIWFEGPQWKEHTIHASLLEPHSLAVVDMDGDGDTDAATCAYGDRQAMWFENDGRGRFTSHLVAAIRPRTTSGRSIWTSTAISICSSRGKPARTWCGMRIRARADSRGFSIIRKSVPPQARSSGRSHARCRLRGGDFVWHNGDALPLGKPLRRTKHVQLDGTLIDDTFAEAFGMRYVRLIVTAARRLLAGRGPARADGLQLVGHRLRRRNGRRAAAAGRRNARRPARRGACWCSASRPTRLTKSVPNRVGQCVMTCPTTAVYDGLPERRDADSAGQEDPLLRRRLSEEQAGRRPPLLANSRDGRRVPGRGRGRRGEGRRRRQHDHAIGRSGGRPGRGPAGDRGDLASCPA